MKTQHKRFCIDRYEWPNKVGALPRYMASWHEAKASCEAIGKRLCSDTEWTLACEGEDRRPYPYGDGYERDQQACNIDKPYIWPHAEKVYDPRTAADELARLDQREASGARTACVSPYGVHDMVGNVDEWVVNVSQAGKPFQSGLKGGYWGPVRTRCRPMTTAHDEILPLLPDRLPLLRRGPVRRRGHRAPRDALTQSSPSEPPSGDSRRAGAGAGFGSGGSPYSRRIFEARASRMTCSW